MEPDQRAKVRELGEDHKVGRKVKVVEGREGMVTAPPEAREALRNFGSSGLQFACFAISMAVYLLYPPIDPGRYGIAGSRWGGGTRAFLPINRERLPIEEMIHDYHPFDK